MEGYAVSGKSLYDTGGVYAFRSRVVVRHQVCHRVTHQVTHLMCQPKEGSVMPAPHTDRRPDVLEWAKTFGWEHTEETFDEDQIVRDLFEKDGMMLRAVWLRTPYSDAMWARGLLERPRRAALTVPRVARSASRASLEAVLSGTQPGM